jgi:heme/copper-type cytochrome/quinol oxidase subunit 3
VVLGVYFLILQGLEYGTSYYSIASGAYGRVFFFGTGFHGMHVCLGAIILRVRALRLKRNLLTSQSVSTSVVEPGEAGRGLRL